MNEEHLQKRMMSYLVQHRECYIKHAPAQLGFDCSERGWFFTALQLEYQGLARYDRINHRVVMA
jgi:hypothetical protein